MFRTCSMLNSYARFQPMSTLSTMTQLKFFSSGQKELFKTDSPAYSNNYHRGLYHLKSHAQRRQRCFSMKYSIQTMKPNVKRKNLYSDILDMQFGLWISTKARKCIMKAGSFDNYLLTTKPEVIDSRFGLYLRGLIKRKQADPTCEVPYIP